jgi:hypothetical protein
MKTKDLVALVVAVIIFLVAGYIAYTQLLPKKTATQQQIQVEVIGSIPSNLDPAALTQLTDTSQVRDYAVPLVLSSGLNNQAVFGQ